MQPTLEQSIRQRAHEIWEKLGRPNGHADQHWLAAEREILAGAALKVAEPPAKSANKKKTSRRKTARKAKVVRVPASKVAA